MQLTSPEQGPDTVGRTGRIAELICEHLEIDPAEIGEQDPLTDFGADSLGLISVLASLEKEFRVVIEPEQVARMVSIAAVREVLAESAGW